VREDGGADIEPGAVEEPGLRTWLGELRPAHGARAAAFDTRLDRSPWFTGVASRGDRQAPPRPRLRGNRNRELPGRGLRGSARGRRARSGARLGPRACSVPSRWRRQATAAMTDAYPARF
jgi:hypothetical protein